MPSRTTLELIVLFAAIAGDVVVLLLIDGPWLRLVLGLVLLALVVWSSARLGVVDLLSRAPRDQIHKRRFVKLRSQVKQLLDEIRRLNWMAVDAERGFRSRKRAMQEMDMIEERLKGLIAEIRATAGQVSEDSEVPAKKAGEEATAR